MLLHSGLAGHDGRPRGGVAARGACAGTAQPGAAQLGHHPVALQHAAGGSPGTVGALTLLEGSPQQDLALLGRIAQPRIIVDHQALQFTSQAPFFLSDPTRTFFVTPASSPTRYTSHWQPSGTTTFTTRYALEAFYHPFTDTFLRELAFGGVDAVYTRRLQLDPDLVRGTMPFNFATEYLPTTAIVQRPAPEPPYPAETIDFSHGGAYAAYNWELFFHAPLLDRRPAAPTTSGSRRRMRWFHYIFDPTSDQRRRRRRSGSGSRSRSTSTTDGGRLPAQRIESAARQLVEPARPASSSARSPTGATTRSTRT